MFKYTMLNRNRNVSSRRFELQAGVEVIDIADAFKLSLKLKYIVANSIRAYAYTHTKARARMIRCGGLVWQLWQWQARANVCHLLVDFRKCAAAVSVDVAAATVASINYTFTQYPANNTHSCTHTDTHSCCNT